MMSQQSNKLKFTASTIFRTKPSPQPQPKPKAPPLILNEVAESAQNPTTAKSKLIEGKSSKSTANTTQKTTASSLLSAVPPKTVISERVKAPASLFNLQSPVPNVKSKAYSVGKIDLNGKIINQLNLKENFEWTLSVVCDPKSPQVNDSEKIYFGNKVVFHIKRSEFDINEKAILQLIEEKSICFFSRDELNSTSKQKLMDKLYNSTSGIVVTEDDQDLCSCENIKVRATQNSIADRNQTQLSFIVKALWPNSLFNFGLSMVSPKFGNIFSFIKGLLKPETNPSPEHNFIHLMTQYPITQQNQMVLANRDKNVSSISEFNALVNDLSQGFEDAEFKMGIFDDVLFDKISTSKNTLNRTHIVIMINELCQQFNVTELFATLLRLLNRRVISNLSTTLLVSDDINLSTSASVFHEVLAHVFESVGCKLSVETNLITNDDDDLHLGDSSDELEVTNFASVIASTSQSEHPARNDDNDTPNLKNRPWYESVSDNDGSSSSEHVDHVSDESIQTVNLETNRPLQTVTNSVPSNSENEKISVEHSLDELSVDDQSLLFGLKNKFPEFDSSTFTTLTPFKNIISILLSENAELTEAKVELDLQVDSLSQALTQKEIEIVDSAKISTLNAELSSQVDRLNNELVECNEKLSLVSAESEKTKKYFESEMFQAEKAYNRTKAQNHSLNEKLVTIVEECNTLKAEIEKLVSENHKLHETLTSHKAESDNSAHQPQHVDDQIGCATSVKQSFMSCLSFIDGLKRDYPNLYHEDNALDLTCDLIVGANIELHRLSHVMSNIKNIPICDYPRYGLDVSKEYFTSNPDAKYIPIEEVRLVGELVSVSDIATFRLQNMIKFMWGLSGPVSVTE